MSSRALWQHPYVNIFKHTKIEEWKKVSKEGDVTTYTDKTLKCSVFRIRGSVPASNYILLPKTSSQSLGLTGRFLYLLFRPGPNKHFTVHLDITAEDGQVIRVSFSNLFKEFRSTATWLQFPFLCGAAEGSVYEKTARSAKQGLVGPASTRWTCLLMDLRYVLSVYLNRTHSHLKSVKLCANMSVKNIITSDLLFDPALSFSEFRRAGLALPGVTVPMPREMCFPVPRGQSWQQLYDYIRFPSDGAKLPFDSIQKGSGGAAEPGASPHRDQSHAASEAAQDRASLARQTTTPAPSAKQRPPVRTSAQPEFINTASEGSESPGSAGQRSRAGEGVGVVCAGDDGVHVFARCDFEDNNTTDSEEEIAVVNAASPRPVSLLSDRADPAQKMFPDPVLKLNRIIGFGGATVRCAVWGSDGQEVVYPCHAVIIAMSVSSGHQRFFIGHTDKVSALALNASSSLLASAQTGTNSLVRLWSFNDGVCQTIIPTHTHTLRLLSFSLSGSVLCAAGKDRHCRTTVILWSTGRVAGGSVVPVLAKAHTDADVQMLKIISCDETRMVSCGLGNVRLWRLRGGSLRSCPVNLGEYHSLQFTDLALQKDHAQDRPEDDHTLFVSSRSGHILEIDYVAAAIKNIRRLLPAQQSHAHHREKQTFNTAAGIAVNSISTCAEFCVTGSEDGFLRLWPLDFSSVFLEAEHEGPVGSVCVSPDGSRVLSATTAGNLGYLDVGSRGYRTLMRSHTASVLGFGVDGTGRRVTTVSKDRSVRVWDMDTMQQLYDFVSDEDDGPCSVAFHPSRPLFACGFSSGTVRVFDIQTSSLITQHRQHPGSVDCVIYSPDAQCLFSSGSLGSLVLYRASEPDHHVLRVVGDAVARGANRGPDALAVSSDGRCLAAVGPTEYTVTVMEAHSLNELLRVDVSILDVESSTLDSALNVCFSPTSPSHLLITTSANKILWINAQTGHLLRQVSEVHKHQCVSLAVSDDGRFLLTAGQNSVKVWDYNLRIHSQVFIGHSELIRQVRFTPDQRGVVTAGDALFFWDFLAPPQEADRPRSLPRRSPAISPRESPQNRAELNGMAPANQKPRGASLSRSSVDILSAERKDGEGFLRMCDSAAEPQLNPTTGHSPSPKHASFLRITQWVRDEDTPTSPANQSRAETAGEGHAPLRPDCYKHFVPRFKTSVLDQTVVAPPPEQAGLSLKAVIGYNGNGRNNMVWNPDTGLFVYSCGCIVVVEDLHTGSQRHWTGHVEEISTLAVTHDSLVVASASGGGASRNSLICIWNVSDGSCRNRLSYHKGAVQSLAFSRDDVYFLSLGDFSEPVVALWSTRSFELLCTVQMSVPLHDAAFCPFAANALTLIGSGAVFFARVQTHDYATDLQVQRVGLPEEVGQAEVTSLCYNTRRLLYTGTNDGRVCVWDCDTHCCFVTWEADEGEIGVLLCSGDKLVTGSNTKKLRLWSIASVQNLSNPNNKRSSALHDGDAQVRLEQELLLDGTVISAAFDDVMDMGIVGTTAGTLWYISWADGSSIRLISGHRIKVNGVVCSPDEQQFVTCGQDGSVRVWALQSHELLVQFQVLNQSCECVCWSPPRGVCEPSGRVCVAGGYSDGTVRIFSLESAEMDLKLQPHPVAVCALQYSHYGHVLLSGGRDGLLTVSSPVSGVTVRTFSDHKGARITTVQVTSKQYKEFGLEGNELWLAVSADRRVSIWAADWSKDKCELLDWLTFPAPGPPEDSHPLPPSLAAFSPSERGVVVYTGYAVEKEIVFYCLYKKQVLRTIALSDWPLCLSLCSTGRLLAVGSNKRALKLIHSSSGRFQDFAPHSDSVDVCSFSWSGSQLFTAAHNELLLWTVHGL